MVFAEDNIISLGVCPQTPSKMLWIGMMLTVRTLHRCRKIFFIRGALIRLDTTPILCFAQPACEAC